jgi:hypothetical protein
MIYSLSSSWLTVQCGLYIFSFLLLWTAYRLSTLRPANDYGRPVGAFFFNR